LIKILRFSWLPLFRLWSSGLRHRKSCSGYQHLGRIRCFIFRVEVPIVPTTPEGAPFPNSLLWIQVTNFLATSFSLEERRDHIPSKRLYPPIRLHCDTTQKTTISTWLHARKITEKILILYFIGCHASHKNYVQVFIIFTNSSKLNGYCLEYSTQDFLRFIFR
jgi:hypothetical protein